MASSSDVRTRPPPPLILQPSLDDVIVDFAAKRPIGEAEYAIVTSGSSSTNASSGWYSELDAAGSSHGNVVFVKATILVLIMVSAVGGNLMVVVSVFCYDKLRRVANSFIVSLALADLLVAMLVMPFNASQIIAGRWIFNRLTCDIFNANDVLFSTASLLHLCCISMDRYIAVNDPFRYEERMTRRRAGFTLIAVWTASACVSHIPIHLGLYTTDTQRDKLATDSNECSFKVNRVYGVISSTISFWTPAVVMIFTYVKIYREARRQEKQIAALASSLPPPKLHVKNTALTASSAELSTYNNSTNGGNRKFSTMLTAALSSSNSSECGGRRASCEFDGQRQRLSNERRIMKREHKAAKTLGVIMGAFLVCWLPFFTWYLAESLCSDDCPDLLPEWGVEILFWIGYANSALNPLIYPCFNRDFRDAFGRLLTCNNRARGGSYDRKRMSLSGGGGVTSLIDSYSLQLPRQRSAVIIECLVATCCCSRCRYTGSGCHGDASEATRLKSDDVIKRQTLAIPMIILDTE